MSPREGTRAWVDEVLRDVVRRHSDDPATPQLMDQISEEIRQELKGKLPPGVAFSKLVWCQDTDRYEARIVTKQCVHCGSSIWEHAEGCLVPLAEACAEAAE